MSQYVKALKCCCLIMCAVFSYWFVFLYTDVMKDMHECSEDINFDIISSTRINKFLPPSSTVQCDIVNENGIGIISLIIHVLLILFLVIGSAWFASWHLLKTLYE